MFSFAVLGIKLWLKEKGYLHTDQLPCCLRIVITLHAIPLKPSNKNLQFTASAWHGGHLLERVTRGEGLPTLVGIFRTFSPLLVAFFKFFDSYRSHFKVFIHSRTQCFHFSALGKMGVSYRL